MQRSPSTLPRVSRTISPHRELPKVSTRCKRQHQVKEMTSFKDGITSSLTSRTSISGRERKRLQENALKSPGLTAQRLGLSGHVPDGDIPRRCLLKNERNFTPTRMHGRGDSWTPLSHNQTQVMLQVYKRAHLRIPSLKRPFGRQCLRHLVAT